MEFNTRLLSRPSTFTVNGVAIKLRQCQSAWGRRTAMAMIMSYYEEELTPHLPEK